MNLVACNIMKMHLGVLCLFFFLFVSIMHTYRRLEYVDNFEPSGCAPNMCGVGSTTQLAMDGWMNSAGHKRNILDPSYKRFGYGMSTDMRGTKYWVQVFTPLNI